MSLKGLDVSHHQSGLNLNKVSYDFVILKATGGDGFVDPKCDYFVQQAIKAKKKWGVYHYFGDGYKTHNPVKEADWFVDNCRGYIGKGILVLDWESDGNPDWQNTAMALEWLLRVEQRTGVKPAIYMNTSTENSLDWSKVVKNGNGLWIADYRGKAPTIKHWPFYFIWQHTSSGQLSGYAGKLDLDTGYLTKSAWDKYAASKKVVTKPQPTPEPTPKPTPKPKPANTAEPNYAKENNALLKQLVEMVKQVLNKLTSIFK